MTVLLLSHPSQSGMTSGKGTSGNVAWNNSVRSRLYLTASDNKENKDVADIRELTVMKANYAAKGGKLMLRYESGAFAVVTKNDKKEANDKADAIFIQLLAQCSCENAIVTTGNKSTYYAPKILARMNGRGPFSFAKGRDRGSACADGMRWPNRLGRSRQSMGWRGAAKA